MNVVATSDLRRWRRRARYGGRKGRSALRKLRLLGYEAKIGEVGPSVSVALLRPTSPPGHFYTLEGRDVAPCDDVMAWAAWCEEADRRVAQTVVCVADPMGLIHKRLVSTVFLGINHNFFGNGPPLLFETMIFEDGDAAGLDWQERCATLHARGLAAAGTWELSE